MRTLPELPEDIVWMPLEEALQTLINNKQIADGLYFDCMRKQRALAEFIAL